MLSWSLTMENISISIEKHNHHLCNWRNGSLEAVERKFSHQQKFLLECYEDSTMVICIKNKDGWQNNSQSALYYTY